MPSEKWLEFYSEIMPLIECNLNEYAGNEVEELEKQIDMDELRDALKRMKNNKAPGIDSITSEFLKGLSELGYQATLEILNNILEEETTPELWTKSVTVMLYKKRDPTETANYRPIAWRNQMLKLITPIIQMRG